MFVLHFHTSEEPEAEYIVLTDRDLNESQYKEEFGTHDSWKLDIYDLSDGSGWAEWPAQLPTDRGLSEELGLI